MSAKKVERNNLILKLRDEDGLSFSQIGKKVGPISKETAFNVYKREKAHMDTTEELSTIKNLHR